VEWGIWNVESGDGNCKSQIARSLSLLGWKSNLFLAGSRRIISVMTRARSYLGNLFPEEDFDQSDLDLGSPRRTPEARVAALEQDAERICMALRALIDALVQRKIVSPQDLKRLILEIDKSDGLVSGGTAVVPVRRQAIEKPTKSTRNR